MFNVAINIFYIYLIFLLMGIGPTLFIYKQGIYLDVLLSLAPVIGLIFTTCFGTYFVLLDWPVSTWAMPWLLISILFSVIYTILATRKDKFLIKTSDSHLWLFIGGFSLTFALLTIPLLVGGLNFTILRGNGTDTFNYITMAGYLFHEPYSFVFSSTVQTLIDKHASYALAQQLLSSRWSVSMLLAWCSAITNLPFYKLEYGFTVLFFLMNYGLIFIFRRRLNTPLWLSVLLAISICVGFFAQFILDIRAMSQISTVPLIIVLVYLLSEIEVDSIHVWKKQILIGFVFSSIVFLYIELIPSIVLGTILFLLIQFLHKHYTINGFIKKYWISMMVVLIMILPAKNALMNFLAGQVSYALSGKNNWHESYFLWLYHTPLPGFWGMSYFINRTGSSVLQISGWILSTILSLFYIFCVIFILSSRKKDIPILLRYSVSFSLASLIQFAYLLWRNQLWAAGKVFTFGYPFTMITLVAGIGTLHQMLFFKKRNLLIKLGLVVTSIWLILQCVLGFARINHAIKVKDYPMYISNHGEYRQHDWNVDNFTNAIQLNHCHALAIDFPYNWLAEYLNFVFGWNIHIVNMYGVNDRSGYLLGKQTISNNLDCMLINNQSVLPIYAKILSKNHEISLIKLVGI